MEEKIIINTDVPLNSNYQNKNIKVAEILSEETLNKLGFKDNKTNWYLHKVIYSERDKSSKLGITISLNISIVKKSRKISIDVLEDEFLQPFDYQSSIIKNRATDLDIKIHKKVQQEMKELMENGIIIGYMLGDYI